MKTLTTLTKIKSKFSRRFLQDTSGIASIEFAIIAPVMIMMYFGLAEMSHAISVDRRISHGTKTAGDMATLSPTVTAEELNEIFSATLQVMGVNDNAGVEMELSSYEVDQDGDIQIVGLATLNDGDQELPDFDPEDLDERLLSPTSGIVVARVAYVYKPLKSIPPRWKRFSGEFTMQETFLFKPRQSARVIFGDDNGDGSDQITCNASNYKDVSCEMGSTTDDDAED